MNKSLFALSLALALGAAHAADVKPADPRATPADAVKAGAGAAAAGQTAMEQHVRTHAAGKAEAVKRAAVPREAQASAAVRVKDAVAPQGARMDGAKAEAKPADQAAALAGAVVK